MKYIKIKNSGEIESQALHLVGASTKRGDKTKIGQFGSGNKYAMAFLLRNGFDLKVFSGTREIKIDTKKETFRENEFNVIYIDGERTSITTEMGKDWQFWQAMREIYCNAKDEGGYSMDYVQRIEPVEGETHFYIDTKKDVTEFLSNFDNYFSTSKKVLFECADGKIVEKTGTHANIYRKGVKCFNTTKTSAFDYDFEEIDIDENRLVKYSWEVEEKIWGLIYQCTDPEVIMTILHRSCDSGYMEGTVGDYSTINSSKISEEFKKCIREINIAPKGYAGLLNADEIHNHVIIPTKVFEAVRGIVKDENVGDKFKISKRAGMYREIQKTELYDETIRKAIYFLKECDFDIPYEIECCIFDDKHVLGCAHDGKILLSDICLEKGVNEVVNTIMEEYIHLKYDVKDETRAFQTAMLTEFISYMKKKNAFSI